MTEHDATQIAFQNGYEKGKQDAVKHGRWEDAYGIRKSKCENCGVAFCRVMEDCNYCPHCGAKMDGDGNG